MKLTEKILCEALLHEEKIVGFQNENFGNFVLIMGSPAAGKTWVSRNLLNLRSFKHLAGDNWLEMIGKKEGADLKDPAQVHDLNSRVEGPFQSFRKTFIQQQLLKKNPENIVVDITGKSVVSVKKTLDIVEGSNYITTLIYVVTSKEECIKRNLERDRVVPIDFLMAVYDDIQETYTSVFSMFDNTWMVANDELWNAFSGEEDYVVIDGKKYLKARTGKFKRPTGRIIKVK